MESKIYPYKLDRIWQDYLLDESRNHGARYNMHLYLDLVKDYTKEGEIILDPMGGVGSCLAATTLGRRVIMIELEDRFIGIAKRNWEHLQEKYNLESDRATILFGNCREILPICGIDCVITSPPYGSSVHANDKWEDKVADIFGSTTHSGYGFGKNPSQIGNMPHQKQKFILHEVYKKCYESLRIGGTMITITKNSIKNKQEQYQNIATIKSCIDAGFSLEVAHKRLCQITGRQRLHMKEEGYVPKDYEDVLVFKKER